MKLDVVSNGIVYMHLFLVALMTIAGFPPIVIYISLLWGAAATWRSLSSKGSLFWNFLINGITGI